MPRCASWRRDLEHWLADEPVSAYPERRLERLARLLRHHRKWTYAGVAGLICLTVVATVAAIVIDSARRREESARHREESARQREELARKEAEANFMMAQTAVDEYFTNVSENTLLKEQDVLDNRRLRGTLLRKSQQYYQQFVNQRSGDPTLRRQLANAYFRVGIVTQEIGSPEQAVASFRSALAIWEKLAASAPNDEELQVRLGDCYLAIGKSQRKSGDLQAAGVSLETARHLLERLVQFRPDSAPYKAKLVSCYVEMGKNEGQLRAVDKGIEALRQAKDLQQELIRRFPNEPGHEQRMAEIINVEGFVHTMRPDDAAALKAFEKVEQICKSLLDRISAGPGPSVSWTSRHWPTTTSARSICARSRRSRRWRRSSDHSSVSRRWSTAHPSVTKFQEKLGRSHAEIADLLYKSGHRDQGLAAIRRSIPILENLVRSDPDTAEFHAALGRSLNTLGYFLDDSERNNQQALPEFEKAVAEQQLAIAGSPDETDYKRYLANALENLGEQYVDLNRVREGLPHYLKAIELRRQVLASHPEKWDYARELVHWHRNLGDIQRRAGDPAGAVRVIPSSAVCAGTVRGRSSRAQGRIAAIDTQIAAALADQNQPQEALKLLEPAASSVQSHFRVRVFRQRAACVVLRYALGARARAAATRPHRGRRRDRRRTP